MPRDHRTSKEEFPLSEALRLREQGKSLKTIADTIGWSFAQVRRKLQAAVTSEPNELSIVDMPVEVVDLAPTSNSAEQCSADDSAALVSVPDNRDIQQTTVQGYALDSAETLADHETRLQMLEGFMAALQAQARQPPVQHITVQHSPSALHSAESVQTWNDPEDAKPERWNLWLPRGLKRRIEAQAKAAGIAPSSLVQRLLMAAINGQGVHDA